MSGPDTDFWAGRTAIVTGGTGFIGAALARRLAASGAKVVVPTRDRVRAGNNNINNTKYIKSNLSNAYEVGQLLAGADILFNLAYDFRRSAAENVALYRAIADGCAAAHVPMLVQASSVAVYDGWPTDNVDEGAPCDGPGHDYKIAKRAIERDIAARVAAGAFDAVILQPTIVYGPASPQWTDALVERMRGGTVILPEGLSGLCNGVHIDDLVEAFIAAARMERGGAERFIISGPKPFAWTDLISAYARACGATLRFEPAARYVPAPPVAPGASGRLKTGLSVVARRASALLAAGIGAARLARLRARLIGMLPRRRAPYRPAAEQARLFHARGVASIAKASAGLRAPLISPEQGLVLTHAYIRARFGSPAD